jgi:hypothetical protein
MDLNRSPSRVLVVACRTASSPDLVDAVRRRAQASPCRFTLLVPRPCHGLHKLVDPEDHGWLEAELAAHAGRALLAAAIDCPVATLVGSDDPMAAIQDALNLHTFDEIILSTLPRHLSRWLRLDLPSKVRGLGVPVTVVTAKAASSPTPSALRLAG